MPSPGLPLHSQDKGRPRIVSSLELLPAPERPLPHRNYPFLGFVLLSTQSMGFFALLI